MSDETKNARPLICRFAGGTNRNLFSLITCDGTYKLKCKCYYYFVEGKVRTENLKVMWETMKITRTLVKIINNNGSSIQATMHIFLHGLRSSKTWSTFFLSYKEDGTEAKMYPDNCSHHVLIAGINIFPWSM